MRLRRLAWLMIVVQVRRVELVWRGAEYSVVRSTIGDIPLCLGGEVDCVQGECSCR